MRKRSSADKPIAMIPNGCDLQAFQPSAADAQPIDALPAGFPTHGLRCVFPGAHGMANGLGAVLDAARVLQQRGRSDIHLVFIGDGKQKPQLVDRQQREQLTNCHFFDPLPKYQLSRILQQVDVGLMVLANVPAFYYGTSPNKFFDYIATGLPVLNNYHGWLSEMIQENACGASVPPDNPVAFAEALIGMADDPRRRQQMGINARRLAETEFGRDQLADRWIAMLEQVQGAKPTASVALPASHPAGSRRAA
jgi:glycosyltransferase involved in cell wall biosynthesis